MARGQEVDAPLHCTNEDNAESAIRLLKFAAEKGPNFLLTETLVAKDSSMATLSVAMLFALAPDEMLGLDKTKNAIYSVLSEKSPEELLECVEYLKKKAFGRGLGSRSQKAIRRVMEAWHPKLMEELVVIQPKEIYALVKLVHPRYKGQRGALVKALISGQLN